MMQEMIRNMVAPGGRTRPPAQVLRNSLSGRRRRSATSQQRSGGLYFLALNQYFIQDKTILAGQNADFGGFLRSKAGSAGRFLVRCPFIGILISSAACGTCAVERFAVAHPSQQSWAPSHRAADGHAFRSAHVPRALCSTDI